MGNIQAVAQTPVLVPVPQPTTNSAPAPTQPSAPTGEVNLDEEQPQNQVEQGNEEQPEQQEQPEVDPEQAEQEADTVVPKTEQNPFAKPDIDKLIQQQFNDDMWRIMKGGLPCLETSANCLQQLQERSVGQSPLLKEIDARIAEANQRVEEAKSRNQKSIKLAILTPGLQYLLTPTPQSDAKKRPKGFLDNIAALFRGDVGLLNGLLNVVGVPLFQGLTGGNEQAQQRSIQISDIQVKIAELQRSRAQLADTIREKVAASLVKFDEARTDFQTAQVVSARAVQQFQVYEIRYIRGNNDTEGYLAQQSRLDNVKAQTYSSWAKMRRAMFELKLLVLSVKDAEI
ncbi:hypothetical protein F7734_09920 [Scytonema sp. UIC 10036]|nr:hypothetical protein [Scytonema sp. UIC 10036]